MTISSYSSMGTMLPINNISKDIISQKNSNSDSSLSIDELGISEEQFLVLDSDSDGLVTQNEIANAIDSKLSSFNGEMPSKEEFSNLLSDLGLEIPNPVAKQSSQIGDDFSSLIMSQYDSNGNSLLSSEEVSLLNEDEFTALDTNGDGSIASDELSIAFEQVINSNDKEQNQSTPRNTGSSIVQDEEYDELDTNKDGIVSQEEKDASIGISTNIEDTKNNIKLLLDTIKLNSQNNSEDLTLSNFKNIMKMMNNQNNNNDLNAYVSNLSTPASSKFSYA